ncbi:hypothetical protein AMTR_s00114p00075080 [Amborella trichopoda]|uniref:Uncharacterized protein n=1 Tax=Amborella trichopoda TaxID=13333 RepID=W1NUF2_AMBTC|nr:hypothetical protein AMTR_s00114p00075080 [Amborella trichopoda]
MGNCCRSPATAAREDVKSNYSVHDQSKKEGNNNKKLIVLSGSIKGGIDEKYVVDRGEFGVTYMCYKNNYGSCSGKALLFSFTSCSQSNEIEGPFCPFLFLSLHIFKAMKLKEFRGSTRKVDLLAQSARNVQFLD